MAARENAAAVASRRAARARRGGQVIGRRVMGRRVTAPSDRSEPIVARPQLTSKACGARLSVSEGGRHVARREDDKCASYGSLFINQSSGRVSVKAKSMACAAATSRQSAFLDLIRGRVLERSDCSLRAGLCHTANDCVHPPFAAAFGARASSKFLLRRERQNGANWGGQFTPRGTTYVFVNVVVAPRYVARVQLGSGGLKFCQAFLIVVQLA